MFKRTNFVAAATAAAVMALAAPYALMDAEAMSTYRWKNRPFVVFAPDEGDPRLERQLEVVRLNNREFVARDMVVLAVTGNEVATVLGHGQSLTAEQLRSRYNISGGGFRSVLVGKDGSVKLFESEPVSAKRLFELIDSMPMRRQEMRRGD